MIIFSSKSFFLEVRTGFETLGKGIRTLGGINHARL